MAERRWVRLQGVTLLVPLLFLAESCKRESQDKAGTLTASLLFDDASPEVREALSSSVDFTITDDNFARWEKAQRNLEALPRSAAPAKWTGGGSPVDRAVARLESSPYTRTAIERTGLSVREFVLETIALAQATEAAHTGKSLSSSPIPPANFRFVQRYSSRALYSGARAARPDYQAYDATPDVEVMPTEEDGNGQMEHEEPERQDETPAELPVDSARDTARDSVRDNLPTPGW